MERRRDDLLRNVVDHVKPNLVEQGFTLHERRTFRECRWVEFARMPRRSADDSGAEQTLALYHLPQSRLFEARLEHRDAGGSFSSSRSTLSVWPYEPRTRLTPDGQKLPSAVRAWVERAVVSPAD